MNLYRKQSAFTLIEVMIALSILSLLLLLLYGSLFTTSKSLRMGSEYIDSIDEYRLIHNFLRQTIEQAQPLMHLSEEGSELIFTGHHDRLGFTATLPSHRGGGGLFNIVIHNENNNVNIAYIPIHTYSNDFILTDIETESVILFKGKNVTFNYYGSENIEQPAEWHRSWENTQQLPSLLKLKFNDDTSEQPLPDMIFSLRVGYSPGKPAFMLLNNHNDSAL